MFDIFQDCNLEVFTLKRKNIFIFEFFKLCFLKPVLKLNLNYFSLVKLEKKCIMSAKLYIFIKLLKQQTVEQKFI